MISRAQIEQPPVPDAACCGVPSEVSRHIVRLQLITVAWMLTECSVALFSAWRAHSPALLVFGCDSLVELLSAAVVLLQFTPALLALGTDRAARLAGILLLLLAGIVAISSLSALKGHVEPNTSWSGIAVTLAALAIMPVLSRAKRTAARKADNRALAADAVQSAVCAYLASITLVGLVVNAAFHVWWVDPVAALAAVPLVCVEGRRALREQSCCR